MQFRDLHIGDTFDFIGPDNMLNSFYRRCVKTGPRSYACENGGRYTVGSVSAAVYHAEQGTGRHAYDMVAVDKAIAASNRRGRRISTREARLIHSLLRG
jgi:hypothetical protein